MMKKILYIHFSDEEYGKRFMRFLSSKRHPDFHVEMVTDEEVFRYEMRAGGENRFYLSDDRSYTGEPSYILLAEESDKKKNTVGYTKDAGSIYEELLQIMDVRDGGRGTDVPTTGVYGVYSPYGRAAGITGALTAQELGCYGKCVYINLSSFPEFYTSNNAGTHSLGELFFRLEVENFDRVADGIISQYGRARAVPGISHYKDLWDIGEKDMEVLFDRLIGECGVTYLVVVFDSVRDALPMVSCVRRFFYIDDGESWRTWEKYAATENVDIGGIERSIFTYDIERWEAQMRESPPETWLDDEVKKKYVSGLLKKEDEYER